MVSTAVRPNVPTHRGVARHRGRVSRWSWVGYLFAIAVSELCLSLVRPEIGVIAHLLLLCVLPMHAAFVRRDDRSLLLALTLPPLVRVVSLGVSPGGVPLMAWVLLTSLPIFVAVGAIVRALPLSRASLGLRTGRFRVQLAIALIGIPCGLAQYLILQPAPPPTVEQMVAAFREESHYGLFRSDTGAKQAAKAFLESVQAAALVDGASRTKLYGATIGLTGRAEPDDQQLGLARRAHAQMFRTTLGWHDLEPEGRGRINPDMLRDLDRIVAAAELHDLKIVFGLARPPCWASADPSKNCAIGQYREWYPPSNPADYGDALRILAGRYGPRVLAWEVWNAPNDARYWGGDPPDAVAYVELVKAARAAAPEAYLLAGGLNGSDVAYLHRMYDAGALGTFDALSLHPYASSPDDCEDPAWSFRCGIPAVRDAMLQRGDDRPVWLTEFGWSSQEGGEDRQAAYLRRSFELLEAWDFVPVVTWNGTIDSGFTAAAPSINWEPALAAILILIIPVALLQELVFRGVVQVTAVAVLGRWGLVYASALFAALHFVIVSIAAIPLAFSIGLIFAWLVARTGSILGVAFAHGVMGIVFYLALPLFVLHSQLIERPNEIVALLAPDVAPPEIRASTITAKPPVAAAPRADLGGSAPVVVAPATEVAAPGAGSSTRPVAPDEVASPAQPSVHSPAELRTVLDEQFVDNRHGWPNNPEGTAWFAEGGYRLFARWPDRFVAVGAPMVGSARDVIVSATFRKVGGPSGGGYGLIVRDQGPGSRDGLNTGGRYYVLEVGDRGELGVWRREEDHWVDLLPWTPSDAVRPGSDSNELSVRAFGDQLTLVVNGIEVVSLRDNALRDGTVGIFVGGDFNEVIADRFVVQIGN